MLSNFRGSTMSPFRKIPYIPTSEKLADMIFSKLKKIRVESPVGAKKKRSDYSFHKTLYFRQFRVIFPELDAELKRIVDSFPIIAELHPFHYELIDVLFGVEKLRIALSRIINTQKSLKTIEREVSKKLGKSETADEAKRYRREALGRMGSTIKLLEEPLDILIESKIQLMKVPDFNTRQKTIAFAGGPNAGKSSFVKLISTVKPEVASYPFTTKELFCGHRKHQFEVIQLIDTPGLLDRPLSERNAIEMKSIVALKHLADYIIYLFDPTDEAPLTIQQQINLLNDIKENFPEITVKCYINKSDILSKEKIAETKKIVGDLETISTLESNVQQLEEIILQVIEEMPKKKFALPSDIARKQRKEAEENEEGLKTQKDDKIEWIFFDEDDKN